MPAAWLQATPNLVDWAQSAITFGAALGACLLLRTFLLGGLSRQATDPSGPAKILLDTVRLPSLLWCLVVALAVSIESGQIPGAAARYASAGSIVFLVASICIVLSTLLVRLAVATAARRGLSYGVSGVSRALIHVFVLLLGATILLRYFNYSLAPLLTALGVGGLAVALALQDTLANFFAGVHILVEAPISVGDFVRLSTGEEGTVSDIGWRTTRVLTGTNNVIVIPNVKITSSILTNYALPDQKTVIEAVIVAALDADIQLITEIAIEEAQRVDGVLPGFQPLVLFDPGVTPTHLQMKLIVQVAHRLQQGLVLSAIRVRLLERFRREGIPLPNIEQVAAFKP